jgi:hypothetical protein
MKPLIFQFKESPKDTALDYSLIEYNETLNLSISKATGRPAIDVLSMDTETFTKSEEEVSDADSDRISALMDTVTNTRMEEEETDSDDYRLRTLMDTITKTSYDELEVSDSDRDRIAMQMLMDTSTRTEAVETTDEDKDWK